MTRLQSAALISCDILIFSAICLLEVILHKCFKPYKRGFFCNDETLRYPFKENTVSFVVLITTVLVLPSSIIILIELIKPLAPTLPTLTATTTTPTTAAIAVASETGTFKNRKQNDDNGKVNNANNGNAGRCCHLGVRLMCCYAQIGYYLFGLALTLITTQVIKYTVGRLRPNFFAVCQPQFIDGSNCSSAINQGQYIENYQCVAQNFSAVMLTQLRQSFPSGHASIFFYSMVYLAIYLQANLGTTASKLWKHLLQFVFIMLALYVSLTRISDYWHHWSDVAAGIALGTLIAFVVALYIARLFASKPPMPCSYYSTAKPSNKSALSSTSSSKSMIATPPTVLPAYTFGTIPYLPHPHAAAAAAAAAAATAQQQSHFVQAYHNYGYVP